MSNTHILGIRLKNGLAIYPFNPAGDFHWENIEMNEVVGIDIMPREDQEFAAGVEMGDPT